MFTPQIVESEQPLTREELPRMSDFTKRVLEKNSIEESNSGDEYASLTLAQRKGDFQVFFYIFNQIVSASTVSLKTGVIVPKTLRIVLPPPIEPHFPVCCSYIATTDIAELMEENPMPTEVQDRQQWLQRILEILEGRKISSISSKYLKNVELLQWLKKNFPKDVIIKFNESFSSLNDTSDDKYTPDDYTSDDNYTMFGKSRGDDKSGGDKTLFKLSNTNQSIHGASITSQLEVDEEVDAESQMIANMFTSAADVAKQNIENGKFCDIVTMYGLHITYKLNEAIVYKMKIDFKETVVRIEKIGNTCTMNEALSFIHSLFV